MPHSGLGMHESFKGLDKVKHLGPSSIGTDTLRRTAVALCEAPERLFEVEAFYRGAGVEQHLVAYYRHLCGAALAPSPCRRARR